MLIIYRIILTMKTSHVLDTIIIAAAAAYTEGAVG
jgi:hypothetical protein